MHRHPWSVTILRGDPAVDTTHAPVERSEVLVVHEILSHREEMPTYGPVDLMTIGIDQTVVMRTYDEFGQVHDHRDIYAPVWSIEDGFIRLIGHEVRDDGVLVLAIWEVSPYQEEIR